MGATLVMVVSLAIVLGLILVLLAELYCSLLLRRRQLRNTTSTAVPSAAVAARTNASSPSQASYPQQNSSPPHPPPPSFTSIYAQGVLQAPRSFLFPVVSCKEEAKKQLSELHHQVIQIQTQDSITSPHQIGLLSASPPPKPIQEIQDPPPLEGSTSGTTMCGEQLMYISNPIYENEEGKASSGENTPFETPHTSPSHLDKSGSSGEDEAPQKASPSSYTPPLSPMKKLPAEACSVSLRDARSLGTSGSESHSRNGLSSSSSGSPCTSPSW
ncbi:endochitinase A [Senna tora]|uniref:Endochitinase A n=1 Tax=Senna tora TaxID=362788 RepID=A0A834TBF9_9FABA|nr:endochitinase A [Senna tora]